MGADYNQCVKAFAEAEAYHGPSIIIAYAPCINHGIKGGMGGSMAESKKAVQSGYWQLYRYNPALAEEGKNPLTYDSKEPTMSYRDFIMNEVRYNALSRANPERAEVLFDAAEKSATEKRENLKKLSEFVRERKEFCFRGKIVHQAAILLSTYDRAREMSRLYSRNGYKKVIGLTALMADIGQSFEIVGEHTLEGNCNDYCDGTYATHEELYRQAYQILENHPNLKVTFAHFFFKSEHPKDLEELFEKYPNMCVDLTPGWEMYLSFYENKEFFKEFFTKYSKRILFGTDAYFPRPTECSKWLADRVYRFISSPDVVKAVADRYESGLCIPNEAIEDITHGNFERRVSETPKEINKEALKAYYAKYKHLMAEKDIKYVDEVFAKFL